MGYTRRFLLEEQFFGIYTCGSLTFCTWKKSPVGIPVFHIFHPPGPPFFGVPAVSFQGKKRGFIKPFQIQNSIKTPSKEGLKFLKSLRPLQYSPISRGRLSAKPPFFFCSRLIFPGCKTHTSPEGSGLSFSLLPSLKQTAKAMLIFQGVRFVSTVFFCNNFSYIPFRKPTHPLKKCWLGDTPLPFGSRPIDSSTIFLRKNNIWVSKSLI